MSNGSVEGKKISITMPPGWEPVYRDFGSHLGLLYHCAVIIDKECKGNIIEIGGGNWSTPMLRELVSIRQRWLVTIEDNLEWYCKLCKCEYPFHKVVLTKELNTIEELEVEYGRPFALGFVDAGCMADRVPWFHHLAPRVDILVAHDINAQSFGGDSSVISAIKSFKYCCVDKSSPMWTIALSNRFDIYKSFTQVEGVW